LSLSETFYWHDYETTGADPAYDRPIQFAGLRTDSDLNPIGAPLVIYNRLTADCLPHPAATRVTGIGPTTAIEQGLSEADFIARIHQELQQPGTCALGYNSIRFDDEVTRFTLYRNFFLAYAREYGQGRTRWDLIDAVRAFYALRPDGLCWPTRDDGLPSFRLEDLTAANNIDHGAAHDALADVQATIALAKKLKQVQPALFETLFAQRTKQKIAPLLDTGAMRPVVHVSGMFGAARSNLAVVVPVAPHPKNSNEIICADLSGSMDFLDQPVETVRSHLFIKESDLPEGVSRPPLKTIRLNKAPVVLPTEWVAGEAAERLGLDGDAARASLATLRATRDADPEGFKTFVQSIFSDREFAPRTDPDTMLYSGFINRADEGLFGQIREASPEQLRDSRWVFSDTRLPELLFRYRARNYPESLSPDERQQWQEHCHIKLVEDASGQEPPFWEAMAAERGRPELSPRQVAALDDLERYARSILPS